MSIHADFFCEKQHTTCANEKTGRRIMRGSVHGGAQESSGSVPATFVLRPLRKGAWRRSPPGFRRGHVNLARKTTKSIRKPHVSSECERDACPQVGRLRNLTFHGPDFRFLVRLQYFRTRRDRDAQVSRRIVGSS